MATPFTWDDLQYFLAVARTGQLSSAARSLRTSHATVSRHIDRLEANGWVDRRPDAEDRRAHRLYLGARVQPLLDQMHGIAKDVFDIAFAGFSDDEANQLIDLLTRMRANLAVRSDDNSLSSPAPRKAAGKPVKETAQ